MAVKWWLVILWYLELFRLQHLLLDCWHYFIETLTHTHIHFLGEFPCVLLEMPPGEFLKTVSWCPFWHSTSTIIALKKQVFVQLPTSADTVALPTFVYSCCWALGSNWLISPARWSHSGWMQQENATGGYRTVTQTLLHILHVLARLCQ